MNTDVPSVFLYEHRCPIGVHMSRGIVGHGWHAGGMTGSTNPVPAALAERLRRQHEVITRQQVLAAGVSRQTLRYRIRAGGPWYRLLPGVYLALTGMPTVDQQEMAALLYAGPGSVITGAAALRRQGVRAPAGEAFDVLIPAGRKRNNAGFVRVIRTTRMPERVVTVGALLYALPPRAVADAARACTSLREVRALVASAVQARRCSLDLLTGELASGPARGSALLRAAVAEVAGGSRSAAETDLRDLISRGRLPDPMLNPGLYDAAGAFIATPDAWWPDAGVVAEVDSREWHLSPEDWQRTMARHAAMTAHGILVLHFSPRQIREQPDYVIATIRAAIARGRTRAPLPIQTRPAAA